MTWLITSDLHLSDRPKDRYRFGLFKWLAAQQKKHNTTATFILGDLTDRKDNHSSTLVNQIVDELKGLKPPVYLLSGNHDFIDPANPFFRFLQAIEGLDFVVEPKFLPMGVAMIPHQPDQASFDRACAIIRPKSAGVMLHQTFAGAIAETGSRLTGLRASLVSQNKPLGVWAGDVHRPQQCGPVTYVGAPYSIRFGDNFEPRVLLVEGNKGSDLHFPCLRKWALRVHDADELLDSKELMRGDQIKVTVTLTREEIIVWSAHKQRVLEACKTLGLEVFGVELEVVAPKRQRVRLEQVKAKTPEDIFNAFCQTENIAKNIREAGSDILKG